MYTLMTEKEFCTKLDLNFLQLHDLLEKGMPHVRINNPGMAGGDTILIPAEVAATWLDKQSQFKKGDWPMPSQVDPISKEDPDREPAIPDTIDPVLQRILEKNR